MSTPLSCDAASALAPDAALDVLDAAERADVLAHVAGCARCRRLLGDLASTADALLLVAPPAEPSAGFEARVFERLPLDAPRSRGRRWLGPALVAAAALVLGLGIGLLVDNPSSSSPQYPRAVALRAADGRAVGQVLISDRPARMVCALDDAPAGATYAVSITADDAVADVGTFTAEGAGRPWSVDLPVDGADVRRVVIRDGTGKVRATAQLR